jgi:hypothetical protein
VLKRLTLLNRNYPLRGINCKAESVQRVFVSDVSVISEHEESDIFYTVRDSFINQGTVFFGAMANRMYMRHLKKSHKLQRIPDFDVLAEDPLTTCKIVRERLHSIGIENIELERKSGIGEIIAPHYEIKVKGETIAFVYKPIGCHSYNVTNIGGKKVRIATIDTMLSFYLAFLYANRPYYDVNRILCMCEFLFTVQEANRLKQHGILRRFSIECYGEQPTIESMRMKKAQKYRELKHKKHSREFEKWFLRYIPADHDPKNKKGFKQKGKKKTRKGRKMKGKKGRGKRKGARKTRKNDKGGLLDLLPINL